MKRRIAVDLLFSIQEVRQTLAILTGECPTDEEINEWFFDKTPSRIDASGMLGKDVSMPLCLVMVSLLCKSEKEAEKPKRKSFSERIAEKMTERKG